MKTSLSEIERLRLDKLIWLYCMAVGDEGPCSVNGSDIPSAHELTSVLLGMDVPVDAATVEALMNGRQGMSDEIAAQVEQGFNMPAGWLSQG